MVDRPAGRRFFMMEIERIKEYRFNNSQRIMLAAPVLLIVSMYFVFKFLVERFGSPLGYYGAMLVYWVVWCLLLPIYILGGPREVIGLFGEHSKRLDKASWKTQLLIWFPLIFPLVFRFLPKLREINLGIFLVSALIGIIIGVTEEILWRGVYIRLFPGSTLFGYVYPSIGFALWHLAPQLAMPNPLPGGIASFVLYALILGLAYGHYARKTGSIRGCTLSHCIHDFLGLPGFAWSLWLR